MRFSPILAQKIVDSLKLTLNHEINFIHTDGKIIASTDPTRIGNHHAGALVAIKTKKHLLIEQDDIFSDTKKGINLPIYFENEIIGVIGLTGEKEVEKLAQILKTMTEVLIKEAYLSEASFQRRERHRLIIESLLFHSQEFLFELDFSTPYQVIVGNSKKRKESLDWLLPKLEPFLEQYPQTYFMITNSTIIILTPQLKSECFLKTIQQMGNLYLGIGLVSYMVDDLKNSFETAKQALKWGENWDTTSDIVYFENLDLGILLNNIPENNKSYYVDTIFKNIPKQDLNHYYLIINTYSKFNGSIQRSAQELFIHKNTFQYQLNKLKNLTGYDPRNYHDFSVLYLAFLLQKEKSSE